MPVTNVETDTDALTLTITAEFAAPVERVWDVYADARQLERVWGPPGYPATFVSHDLTPGTRSTYFMTGPEGEKFGGYWDITGVQAPSSFTFDDGFANADDDFAPVESMPTSSNVYTLTAGGAGTVATYVGTYSSAEGLQTVLDMGVIEGASAAIGQIDDLLAQG